MGEDWEVEIIVPRWAMHKLKGGDPPDAFEEEGGESMWELYVQDQGENAAKKALAHRAAKEQARELNHLRHRAYRGIPTKQNWITSDVHGNFVYRGVAYTK